MESVLCHPKEGRKEVQEYNHCLVVIIGVYASIFY
jgi:hypothetical protein